MLLALLLLQAPPVARLQTSIERITSSVNATWGVYAKCLESGEEVALHADRRMDTMSVIKIPLMVEVFEQIKAGKFGLGDKYTLTKEDVRPGTGILRSLDPGAVVTVKDLLGHSDISTTMRYAHSNDEAKRRAVQKLRNSDKTVTVVPRKVKIAV